MDRFFSLDLVIIAIILAIGFNLGRVFTNSLINIATNKVVVDKTTLSKFDAKLDELVTIIGSNKLAKVFDFYLIIRGY